MNHVDTPFVTVRWDEALSAVHMEWKTFVDGNDLRKPLLAGLDLLEAKSARKWLGDLRGLGAVPQADQQWTLDVWTPRAVAAGLAYLAFVSPRKVVAKMAMRTFITKVHGKELVTTTFDDIEQARTWLRAQK